MARSQALIAPSILAADIAELGAQAAAVVQGGADLLHIDVMDGSFVPPITFGANVIAALHKRLPAIHLETHLMVVQPERHFEACKEAGAGTLIIHQETCPHLHRSLGEIRSLGMRSGVAINPGTPASAIFDVLEMCDMVLVMTVNPGWGGQPFLPHCLKKIEAVQSEIDKSKLSVQIEVDGGINAETAKACYSAGATVFVAGSYIFGSSDLAAAIRSLRS